MDSLNRSSISPKAFTLQAGDSDLSFSSHQRRTAARHRTTVMIAAWVEIIVGASFFLVPNAQSQFLFGTTPDGIGALWVRFAGIALIGLGIACLPSNRTGTSLLVVQGLLGFNIAVAIFFAWIAFATTFRGVGLWPVVIGHAVIATALALSLRHEDTEEE